MESMRKLSEREREIMAVILAGQQAPSLHEIMDEANRRFNRQWKPQTVSTFLGRMVEKGYLTAERKGRYTLYEPTRPTKEYRRQELQNIVDLFYNGNVQQAREDLESCTGATEN